MKTIIRSFLAVAFIFATTSTIKATEAYVYVAKEKTFILSVGNFSSDINIRLMDSNGYSFYKDFVKEDKAMYQKWFDVSSLPNGEYQIAIEDEMKVIMLSMKIENNKIVGKELAQEKAYKPMIHNRGAKVFVSQFAFNKSPVSVIIYNDNQEVVHEDKLNSKVRNGRVYEFKRSGDYTIVLSSNDKIYSHAVTVKKVGKSFEQIVYLNK